MIKIFLILFVMAMFCALAACSSPVFEPEDTQSPTTQQPTRTVEFTDPTLEAMVRAAMCKPDGDITLADAEAVTALNLSYEWQRLLPDAVRYGRSAVWNTSKTSKDLTSLSMR